MANSQYFWDRVSVLVNGLPYLEKGEIRTFSMQASYNTRLQQSMTPNGVALGLTAGNKSISFSWTEFLPPQSDYINWRTFTLAEPNAIITIIPISIASGIPIAPSFTITGIGCTSQNMSASGEGEIITRDCQFIASDSSNT
jgi:hypothetical protein